MFGGFFSILKDDVQKEDVVPRGSDLLEMFCCWLPNGHWPSPGVLAHHGLPNRVGMGLLP